MLTPEEQERLFQRHVLLSRESHEPLHAQLTRSLRNLITRYFEKGERFYPEEELSERLGLSVGTVRRSLNRLVDEGLLLRRRGQGSFVFRSALEIGGGMRVAVVLNTFDSPFNNMLMRELSYLCQRRNHSLEAVNPGQDERVSKALELASAPRTRFAFIFLCLDPDFTYDLAQAAQSRNLPSLNIDTWIPGYPGTQICVDNQRGIELGLEHLCRLGHRRIALLLSENPEHENIRERLEAFRAGIANRGLEGRIIESSPPPDYPHLSALMRVPTQERYDGRIDEAAARRVLESNATAVLCVSDIGACFLMKRLHMMGVRIPEDLSVAGFNDEGAGLMMHPELTTIAQPYAEMAAVALDALGRADTAPRHFRLEPKLVIRKSTGAPKPDVPAQAKTA